VLHALNASRPADYRALIHDADPDLQVWGTRLAMESDNPTAYLADLTEVAANPKTPPRVRRALAEALRGLPDSSRLVLAEKLLEIAPDPADPNPELMIWYGIEPLLRQNLPHATRLLTRSRSPLLRQFLGRRLAQIEPEGLETLVHLVADPIDKELRYELVRGMLQSLRGRRQVPKPEGWSRVRESLRAQPDSALRVPVEGLALLFGEKSAAEALLACARDTAELPERRIEALRLLVDNRTPEALASLRLLIADSVVRSEAIRGLAAYDAPDTPALILQGYARYAAEDKALAIATLASRPTYALALLDAVERGVVPRGDITPFVARQIAQLKDKNAVLKLEKVWGVIRPPDKDKTKALARYKALAAPERQKGANRAVGRALFAKHCASCHKLFGEGGSIGPELTGSQRANPEYILTELLDPSAVVPREYRVVVVATAAGRTITGIVADENDQTIAIQTPTELIRLPKSEIDDRKELPQSLMPEGLLAQMSDDEIRDLLAYLASPQQVALPTQR
jgi:putative heme-binding domain-containing protein